MILSSLIFLVSSAAAGELDCTLDESKYGEYPPHTKVEADLNGDGHSDIFYLAGEEEEFQTCVFLAEKTKTGTKHVLVHSNDEFYNTVLDLDGSGVPQILVAEELDDECEPASEDFIPEKLRPEIREFYDKHVKTYEKFNFTYSMPDVYPVMNLFLLNDVKVFKFKGNSKVDVTKDAKPYLQIKKKVLEAATKNKDVPAACKKALSKTLKNIS